MTGKAYRGSRLTFGDYGLKALEPGWITNQQIEAARIDGCSEFKIFRSIVIPMSKPVLATISLFTAVGHWNDWYSGSFFVRDPLLKPLATLLQEMLTSF